MRIQLQERDKVAGGCGGELLWHGEWDWPVPPGWVRTWLHPCGRGVDKGIMITLGLVLGGRERHQRPQRKVPPTIRLSTQASESVVAHVTSCHLCLQSGKYIRVTPSLASGPVHRRDLYGYCGSFSPVAFLLPPFLLGHSATAILDH